MDNRETMYYLLEEMIDSASRNNKQRVRRLNSIYDSLVDKTYSDPPTDLDLKYDNCRASCVVSFSMPWMRDKFLLDATMKFSSIPKPGKKL